MSEEQTQMEMFRDDEIDETVAYGALLAYPREGEGIVPFVKRVWIRNLKGFENLEAQFAKFNVLVGPNNCGKSTILQAIDLCFRLIQFHSEFQRGVLVKPRAGRQVLNEMLPVADPEDFWFRRRVRIPSGQRIPAVVGVELEGGYEFEFEIKHVWGGQNSRMPKLPEGLSEEKVRGILARRPTLVPSSVGVVAHEEWRTQARLELLSLTGHHNEVLRNNLFRLSDKDQSVFKILQDDLQRHFGGTISPIRFSLEGDQYIRVSYQEDNSVHDIFSAGSGFLQILQLLTFVYLQKPGVVLLDEPDAHLHSSLQKLVVDLLEALSQREGIQVVIATHSKEIINYVDASQILPISRSLSSARSLEHHSSVLPILQDLGAIDNADLAALIASKRCAFVEGPTDKTLLAHFGAKLGSTVFEGASQVVVIPTEGVDNPEKYVSIEIFERVVGMKIRAVLVRDRDTLPDSLISAIIDYAEKKNRHIVCLSKTHIENYLLVPKIIWRVICAELQRHGADKASLPTEEEVAGEIEKVIDSLYTKTFDYATNQIHKYYASYDREHLEPGTTNKMARDFLEERWKTSKGKFSLVLGKEALKSVRVMVQDKWHVSFTNNRIVEAMSIDEIDNEIKKLISGLENM